MIGGWEEYTPELLVQRDQASASQWSGIDSLMANGQEGENRSILNDNATTNSFENVRKYVARGARH